MEYTTEQMKRASYNRLASTHEKICIFCENKLVPNNWTYCLTNTDRVAYNYYKCDDCFKKMHPNHIKLYVSHPVKPRDKVCIGCKVSLTLDNWYANLDGSRNKTGHSSYKCKDCCTKRLRNKRKNYRKIVIETYGYRCVCCGLSEYELFDMDHINNDGYIERRTGKEMMKWIIDQGFPRDKYQILCKNCNRTKMMLKGQPCNCQDPSSSTISPQKFERPKKYLNVKFQPFETKKCTDCQVSLTDANYTPTSNGHSLKYVCKPCRSNRNAQYALQRRMKVLEAYGCKCNYCGYDKPLALEVDHIFNDGKQERKEKKIKDFYRFLIQNNYPKDRYQLLCANCNYIKQKGLKKAKRLKK